MIHPYPQTIEDETTYDIKVILAEKKPYHEKIKDLVVYTMATRHQGFKEGVEQAEKIATELSQIKGD